MMKLNLALSLSTILIGLMAGRAQGTLGQDTILLVNGREFAGQILGVDSQKVRMRTLKKPAKFRKPKWSSVGDSILVSESNDTLRGLLVDQSEKMIRFSKPGKVVDRKLSQCFSTRGPAGESVIYVQDTTVRAFYLATEDARAYAYGKRSARKYYREPWSFVGGALSGIGGGFLDYFYAALPPLVFTAINGAIRPKVKQTGPEDQPYLTNEYFVEGYRSQAAKIKIRNSVITALPGLALSLTLNNIFFKKK
jgi:hypothetical protein